ncbi:hypothetical protein A2U01_0066407, partial [Trifolium medium]|nr:hypothetical protein [Trifolium medium]
VTLEKKLLAIPMVPTSSQRVRMVKKWKFVMDSNGGMVFTAKMKKK